MPPESVPWLNEHLRVTAFPLVGEEIDAMKTFVEVVGREPDEIHAKRDTGQQVLQLTHEDHQLTLLVQPDRVHWYLLPNPGIPPAEKALPSIGKYPDKLDELRRHAQKWFQSNSFPQVARVAYGAILLCPVESRIAGYNLLLRYVPSLNVDPEKTSELLYQINRWRTVEIRGREDRVNRLTRWSVSAFRVTNLALAGVGVTQVREDEAHALRLELDMNTAQEKSEPLARDAMDDTFGALVSLGDEIADEGDIP